MTMMPKNLSLLFTAIFSWTISTGAVTPDENVGSTVPDMKTPAQSPRRFLAPSHNQITRKLPENKDGKKRRQRDLIHDFDADSDFNADYYYGYGKKDGYYDYDGYYGDGYYYGYGYGKKDGYYGGYGKKDGYYYYDEAPSGSAFVYESFQLDTTVTAVPQGVLAASEVGRNSPPLFCTGTMCAGWGRAILLGVSPTNDDEDYLEVIISGPAAETEVFGPDGAPTGTEPATFTFYCPNSFQEVRDVEVQECECIDGGSCTDTDFLISDLRNPVQVQWAGTTCEFGFRAQIAMECRD